MRVDDIKAVYKALGSRGFSMAIADLLEGRDQLGRQIPKKRAEEFSIRALWEALVGPVGETLPSYMSAGRFNFIELQEAVDSSSFPNAVGVLISNKVIEGYDQPMMIGDQLVTTMTSKLRQERIIGFTSLEGPLEVQEGMPYQESGFGEKFVTTDTAKKGRILEITEEAIFFDQTGQLLMRASRLGEMTREEREVVILGGVLDVGSGAIGFKDVYRPSGVATTLYSAANTNLVTGNNPLVDWTDIDAALLYHANNAKDDRLVAGERLPIIMNPRVLLTGRGLMGSAARILSATEHRSQPAATDASSVLITGNPVNNIAPGLKQLSSPLVEYLAGLAGSRYNDANDWFIGDPQKQFIWQEIWPLQTMRAMQNDEAQFRRDIVARFKVRYFGGIAAIDTKYWLKVNAA